MTPDLPRQSVAPGFFRRWWLAPAETLLAAERYASAYGEAVLSKADAWEAQDKD